MQQLWSRKREGEATQVMHGCVHSPDHRNYGEAIESELKDKWVIAMTEEGDALKDNGVWLVKIAPQKIHVLHNKWVYKTKSDADGVIERFKARLDACGNEQVYEAGYGLTFASVMDLATVKAILVFALGCGRQPLRHSQLVRKGIKGTAPRDITGDTARHENQKNVLKKRGVDTKDKLALKLQKSLYGLK